eukprot:3784074-Prymnesium_polylepis.3
MLPVLFLLEHRAIESPERRRGAACQTQRSRPHSKPTARAGQGAQTRGLRCTFSLSAPRL